MRRCLWGAIVVLAGVASCGLLGWAFAREEPPHASRQGALSVDARRIASSVCSLSPELREGELRDSLPTTTGFCIDDAGHVVSSLSMLGAVATVGVKAASGAFSSAKVIGSDPWSDTLVVLPDRGLGLAPLRSRGDMPPQLAEPVRVVGGRLGAPSTGSALAGIVSAPDAALGPEDGFYRGSDPLMEISVPFFPGFQGAPVVSEDGSAVGVVVGCAPRFRNITLAKRIGAVARAAEEIIDTGGSIRRPDIGFGLSGTLRGNRWTWSVDTVREKGPAAQADLRVGDTIAEVAGVDISVHPPNISRVLDDVRAGDALSIGVAREGGPVVQVTVVPDEYVRPPLDFERPFLPRPDAER